MYCRIFHIIYSYIVAVGIICGIANYYTLLSILIRKITHTYVVHVSWIMETFENKRIVCELIFFTLIINIREQIESEWMLIPMKEKKIFKFKEKYVWNKYVNSNNK